MHVIRATPLIVSGFEPQPNIGSFFDLLFEFSDYTSL
jgi:hypothetical protein